MAWDFPASPGVGQVFTPPGGPTYTYSASGAWQVDPLIGIVDAPNDGALYGRKAAAWAAAQAALGFTPIQQGGGTGQTTNKVYVGWSAGSALKAQVDTTDLGSVWTNSITPYSAAGSGYQKLGSGLIIEWGAATNASADFTITLPLTFPSTFLFGIVSISGTPSTTQAVTVNMGATTTSGIVVYRRLNSAGTVSATTSGNVNFIAIGY